MQQSVAVALPTREVVVYTLVVLSCPLELEGRGVGSRVDNV